MMDLPEQSQETQTGGQLDTKPSLEKDQDVQVIQIFLDEQGMFQRLEAPNEMQNPEQILTVLDHATRSVELNLSVAMVLQALQRIKMEAEMSKVAQNVVKGNQVSKGGVVLP